MTSSNPSALPPIALEDVSSHGRDLNRPECVLCTASGDIYASDKSGGIRHIGPDGASTLIGANPDIIPNGFALLADGTFAIANLAATGGVWQMDRSGAICPMVEEVDGRTLPSVNFVWLDDAQRLWICVSTGKPGEHRFRKDACEGYIAVHDASGTRIAAEGLGWTNECRMDLAGDYLYVNETFGRRLTRFRLHGDASLGPAETVTEFGAGTYPDGMAMDEEGGIWVVSVVSNRVIRVTPDGKQQLLLEDCDLRHVNDLEDAFQGNRLTREMVYDNRSVKLQNITSVAFGGPDRRTVYMGSISGNSLAVFHSSVAGLRPVHWNW